MHPHAKLTPAGRAAAELAQQPGSTGAGLDAGVVVRLGGRAPGHDGVEAVGLEAAGLERDWESRRFFQLRGYDGARLAGATGASAFPDSEHMFHVKQQRRLPSPGAAGRA